MKKEIIISVVICAYNAERFIEEAIDSVLNQDFSVAGFEIIVVDDGSKDKTAQILKEKYDGKIRYIYQKNGGHTAAVNTALEYVNGKYVCFLDADDYWDDQKLQNIFAAFESDDNIDVVYNYYKLVDENRCVIGECPSKNISRHEYMAEYHRSEYLAGRTPFCPPTSGISVRNSCMRKIGRLPEDVVFPDVILWNILPLYFRKIAYIPKSLHFYRIHEANVVGIKPQTLESIDRDIDFAKRLQFEIDKHARLLSKDVSFVYERMEQMKNVRSVEKLKYEGRHIKAFWYVLTHNFISFRRCRYPFAYWIYFRAHTILSVLIPPKIFIRIRKVFVRSKIAKLFFSLQRLERETTI